MANRRGKGWDFPDYGNDAQKLAIAKTRIEWLENENKRLRERIAQLEDELLSTGIIPPDEILEAEIVEDLDNE